MRFWQPISKDRVIKRTQHAGRLQQLLKPWTGEAVRHIPQGPYDVYDMSRAGLAIDNRWNGGGEPTLYLAADAGVALAEWARHLRSDRHPSLVRHARSRQLYRFEVALTATLDLRAPAVWKALSLTGVPHCFLDKTLARATAQFIRRSTPAEALFVPSAAFLDALERWVLVLFLEKLSTDLRSVLTAPAEAGIFRVSD